MRKIKFRGQDIETKEWVFGGIDSCGECISTSIGRERYIAVDLGTIGQFTGVYDKENKEIYEGDIVEIEFPYVDKTPPFKKSNFKTKEVVSYGELGDVKCFLLGGRSLDLEVLDKDIKLRVIGDIYE